MTIIVLFQIHSMFHYFYLIQQELLLMLVAFGGTDGSVDLEVIGGNPPFIYNWNTGFNSQDLTNLSSAVYSVNITDATNCTIFRDVIITSPQQLAVTNIEPILCFGDSTGTSLFTNKWRSTSLHFGLGNHRYYFYVGRLSLLLNYRRE